MRRLKQIISFLLVFVLCSQLLIGCGNNNASFNSSGVLIKETTIDEKFIKEDKIDEQFYSEQFITENVIYEDGIYEYIVDDIVIGEGYCFQVTITENFEEEILSQLPPEIEDYDIDWPAVIAKFAVGTTIIIATGVVGYFCPSTYYVMASPVEVGTEALIGGAMAAAIEVGINELKAGGNLSEDAVKKYAIEGFADGYMWGAITSVLRVTAKNIKRPSSLTSESGEVLKIALDGAVKNASGKVLGKAYYAKDGIYILKEAGGVTAVELFDAAGKKIVNATAEQLAAIAGKKLPANTVLALGEGTVAQICRTDAEGVIYSINGELLKNTTYKLGNAVYKTDSLGRIIEVSFDKLELKEAGRPRKIITNTINEIGKGYELPGDQRGHIIADRFNGNNTLANMVPMSADANQGQYAAIEDLWAEALTDGKNVTGSLSFTYSGESFRPDRFKVTYDIGEGLISKIIVN